MNAAQSTVEATVLEWPDMRAKPVFGHRGYVRSGKMIGFLAGEGVAVKAWAGPGADALYARDGVEPFSHGGVEMRAWAVLPLRDDTEVEAALSALHEAYERTVAT